MIICGRYKRDRKEGGGKFRCPHCKSQTYFTLIRTWNYFHVYFIPVAKDGLIGERIECQTCGHAFPITALAAAASGAASAHNTSYSSVQSIADNFGNVLQLTEQAIEEVKRRLQAGNFEIDVAVRVSPVPSERLKVIVQFDYALADGRDWIGQCQGIPIVVSRNVASELQGSTIDFRDNHFFKA